MDVATHHQSLHPSVFHGRGTQAKKFISMNSNMFPFATSFKSIWNAIEVVFEMVSILRA